MHSPASNNDKDPYEVECHIRAQCVCVCVGAGQASPNQCFHPWKGIFQWCDVSYQFLKIFLNKRFLHIIEIVHLPVGGADYPGMVFGKGGATQGGWWTGGDLYTSLSFNYFLLSWGLLQFRIKGLPAFLKRSTNWFVFSFVQRFYLLTINIRNTPCYFGKIEQDFTLFHVEYRP